MEVSLYCKYKGKKKKRKKTGKRENEGKRIVLETLWIDHCTGQ